jgi:dethiobiotin synthetase
VVVGAWPADPDLAAVCNLDDLPAVTGVPLVGAMPDGAGTLPAEEFAVAARHGLAAALGGEWQTAHP